MRMHKRYWIAAVMALAALLFLAGCGSEEKQEGQAQAPEVIRIGTIRVPNDKQVAIKQGFFKDYFDSKGIKTEFVFFDSGVAANQAFSSGSIDFAEMGYANAVVACATDIPVELIWLHEILGTNEALVAKKEIVELSDLAGKKVATPFSSTSHFSLLNALKDAGLDKDVTLLDMQTSEIVAAWERGDIDAAYTWEPTLSTLKESGHVLTDSCELAEQGYLTANVDLVHQDFAKQYPDLVADYLLALNQAVELYQTNPDQAASAAAADLGLTKQEALQQMQGTTWLNLQQQLQPEYLGEANDGQFYQVFATTAEFLQEQGTLQEVPDKKKIETFIQPDYIHAAIEKNRGEGND